MTSRNDDHSRAGSHNKGTNWTDPKMGCAKNHASCFGDSMGTDDSNTPVTIWSLMGESSPVMLTGANAHNVVEDNPMWTL